MLTGGADIDHLTTTNSSTKSKTKTRNMTWTDWKSLVHVHGFTTDLLPANAIHIFSKHGEVKLIFAFRTRTTGKNHLFVQYATQEQANAARGKYGQGWQGDPVYHKSVYPVYEVVSKRAATYRWDGVASIVPEMLPPSTLPVALARPHAGDQTGSGGERERERKGPVRDRYNSGSSAFTSGSWTANAWAEEVDRPSRVRGRQEYSFGGEWNNRNDHHVWMEECYGSEHRGEMLDVKAMHEPASSNRSPASKSLTSRIGRLYSDELLDEESSERTGSRSHCRHESSQQTEVDGSRSKDHRHHHRDYHKDKDRKDHHHHHRSRRHRSSRSRSQSRSYSCSRSHSHHRSRSPSTKTSHTVSTRAKDQASDSPVKGSRNHLDGERQSRSRHHQRSEKEDVDLLKAAPIAPVVASKPSIVGHSKLRPTQDMLHPHEQLNGTSHWAPGSTVEEKLALVIATLPNKPPLVGPNSTSIELEGEDAAQGTPDSSVGTSKTSKTPPSGPAVFRANSVPNNTYTTPISASAMSSTYLTTPKFLSFVPPASHHSSASAVSAVWEAGEISPSVDIGKTGKASHAHDAPKPAPSPFGPSISHNSVTVSNKPVKPALDQGASPVAPVFPFSPRFSNIKLGSHIVDQLSPSHAKGSSALNARKELAPGARLLIKDGKVLADGGSGNQKTPYPSPVTSPLVENFMLPKVRGALQLVQPENSTAALDAGLLVSSAIQFPTALIEENSSTPSALAQFQTAQIARLRELYQISQVELTMERVAKRKAEDDADKERSMRRKLEDQLWEMSAIPGSTGVVDR